MKVHEIQQALEALGVWQAIKKAGERGESITRIISGGVKHFISLFDTPDSYSGQAGKFVKVKSTEDGLEFEAATQYTDKMAQDAVGGSVGNGLDYNDVSGSVSVDETELDHNSLANLDVGNPHTQYLNKYGDIATGDIRGTDFIKSRSLTVTRDANNLILQVNKTDGRTIIITRDANNLISSFTDSINTWTVARDVNNLITGVTVT